jgi:hypothetical protein
VFSPILIPLTIILVLFIIVGIITYINSK